MISLGSGMPAPSTFPIADVQLTLKDGTSLALGEQLTAQALQYSATDGLPPLVRWIHELQRREHGAACGDAYTVSVGTGSQNSLHLALQALLDPGDAMLADAYAYPGALESVRPMGVHVLGVPMDAEGLLPDELERLLVEATVREVSGGRKRPKVLYTVPTGHNPCGCTMSAAYADLELEPRKKSVSRPARSSSRVPAPSSAHRRRVAVYEVRHLLRLLRLLRLLHRRLLRLLDASSSSTADCSASSTPPPPPPHRPPHRSVARTTCCSSRTIRTGS